MIKRLGKFVAVVCAVLLFMFITTCSHKNAARTICPSGVCFVKNLVNEVIA